jgi:hypothetical protein
MIPTWLVQLGSLAGLLAFCLTIWDRMLSARPLVWISPGDYGRQVHCKNIATCDITIRTIRCRPSNIGVASSTSLNAVVRASAGQGFIAILKADEEREFSALDFEIAPVSAFKRARSIIGDPLDFRTGLRLPASPR